MMKAERTAGTGLAVLGRLPGVLRNASAFVWPGLAALAFLCLGAGSALYPFLGPEEARHAGIVYDMWAAKQYLMPRVNGFPVLDGAPLYYWVSLAFLTLFGAYEWVLRLPSVVSGVLLLFFIGKVFLPPVRKAPLVLTLFFLMQPAFLLGGRFASPDMLGLLLLTVSLGGVWKAVQLQEQGEWATPWVVTAWGALALLGLAVGPLAILLPMFTVGIWLAFRRRLGALRILVHWLGLLLFIVLLLPWWLKVYTDYPGMAWAMLQRQFFSLVGDGRQGWLELSHGRCWLLVLAGSLPLLVALLPYCKRSRLHLLQAPLAGLMACWLLVQAVLHPLMILSSVGYLFALLVPLLYFAVIVMVPTPLEPGVPGAVAWLLPLLAALAVGGLGGNILGERQSDIAPIREVMARHYNPATDKAVMLDRFDYDFNFYMGSSKLVHVSADWASHEGPGAPRWMRDMSESARFVPQTAARLLLSSHALDGPGGPHRSYKADGEADRPAARTFLDRLCERRVVNLWVISDTDALAHYPVLNKMLSFAATDTVRIWYLEAGRAPWSYCSDEARAAMAP